MEKEKWRKRKRERELKKKTSEREPEKRAREQASNSISGDVTNRRPKTSRGTLMRSITCSSLLLALFYTTPSAPHPLPPHYHHHPFSFPPSHILSCPPPGAEPGRYVCVPSGQGQRSDEDGDGCGGEEHDGDNDDDGDDEDDDEEESDADDDECSGENPSWRSSKYLHRCTRSKVHVCLS